MNTTRSFLILLLPFISPLYYGRLFLFCQYSSLFTCFCVIILFPASYCLGTSLLTPLKPYSFSGTRFLTWLSPQPLALNRQMFLGASDRGTVSSRGLVLSKSGSVIARKKRSRWYWNKSYSPGLHYGQTRFVQPNNYSTIGIF